ncbi:MAG: ATP-binding cassette domain-containing protein, partial [Firmicutes bacterium]|nr:ATP-binding cassette domain-containing protein [Bacillota bacterium]
PTGAGKTTVTSLMARFYDATAGEIMIDGINIRDMTLASLRNQISMVMQDVFLFNGTIAQNIAYGRADDVSPGDIINAAKTAFVHEFIDSLPDKYDTKIGERGVRLSGGQKQRIAIARAILRNSPILILDEATSAVDNETEKEIQNAINAIAGLRTVIVIAHRLSTVEKADGILFLKDGCVVERGTHAELMELGGRYANMKKY